MSDAERKAEQEFLHRRVYEAALERGLSEQESRRMADAFYPEEHRFD